MALETQEEIKQFLILQQKSDQDLKTLCEGMELSSEGSRDQLISKLLSLTVTPQTDIFQPQLIALRTRFGGESIPGTEDFMQRMRRLIYNGKGNTKDFSILNGKNEPYQMGMRYAKLSEGTLLYILGNNMIYPHQSQKELVKTIKEFPEKFLFHIVNRQYGKDKTFIMLHVSLKI
jgi:hypothetical protein